MVFPMRLMSSVVASPRVTLLQGDAICIGPEFRPGRQGPGPPLREIWGRGVIVGATRIVWNVLIKECFEAQRS
jgi:hypothetical protein